MANYEPITAVTIYVRARKIMRNGKRVDGWQAGFTRGSGGVTSTDKYEVLKIQHDTAARHGVRVTDVVEE